MPACRKCSLLKQATFTFAFSPAWQRSVSVFPSAACGEDLVTRRILILYSALAPLLFFYIGSDTDISICAVDLLFPVALLAAVRTRRVSLPAFSIALLFYGACAAISVVVLGNTSTFGVAALKCCRLWGILAPLVLVNNRRIGQATLNRCTAAFVVSGFVSILIGLVLFFGQLNLVTMRQSYVDGGVLRSRAGGLFGDSSAFGHLLATWTCVSLLLYAPRLSRTRRILTVSVVLCIVVVGIQSSLSRAALLNLLVVFFARFVFAPSRLWVKMAAIICMLCLAGIAVQVLDLSRVQLGAPFVRLAALTETDAGTDELDRFSSGRLTIWARSIDLWLERPLTGVGYKGLALIHGASPDNNFLLALTETGIGGFIALTSAFMAVFIVVRRRALERDPYARAFLLLWIGQTLHALTVDVFTFPGSCTVLILLTAAWMASRSTTGPARPAVVPLSFPKYAERALVGNTPCRSRS